MKHMAAALAALFLTASFLTAQSKIGVVDVNQVIQRSAKGKQLFESISAFVETKRAEISTSVEAFNEKRKQSAEAQLTPQQRSAVARELERMQTDIKRAQEDAERERTLRLQEGARGLEKELTQVIRQIGVEMNLDLILNPGPDSGILYHSQAIDLTEAVLARYDQADR